MFNDLGFHCGIHREAEVYRSEKHMFITVHVVLSWLCFSSCPNNYPFYFDLFVHVYVHEFGI